MATRAVRKAVITAAGPDQAGLVMQRFIDRDGVARTALAILVADAVEAGCEEVVVVVAPGAADACAAAAAAGAPAVRIEWIEQAEPRGYGDAVLTAAGFAGGEPVLHMVGDHLWLSAAEAGCARQVVEVAQRHGCAVSGVQATPERELLRFGVVAGPLLAGHAGVYRIERVIEKPTPTLAEQVLAVPGLRAGRYLCFFGLHVLTPAVFEILAAQARALEPGARLGLSPALAELAAREQYLAFEVAGRRYDLGAPYGMLTAQLALALAGRDREEVLAQIVELLATRGS